jgi:hypothetical protein
MFADVGLATMHSALADGARNVEFLKECEFWSLIGATQANRGARYG